MSLRVLAVYGTRPEAIKLAPVVAALRRRAARCEVTACSTGQHKELLDSVEHARELRPDVELDLMLPGQPLNLLLAQLLEGIDRVLAERSPVWLLIQGDTSTALAAGLAAFHRLVRVAHVEAGLRTGDLAQPHPEEANRRLLDHLSDLLFAPTATARRALLGEGLAADRIHVTGNTGVDALLRVAATLGPAESRDEVLVTVHRRESLGSPLDEIFAALRELAERFPAVHFFFPVHLNPRVRDPARERLAGLANVELAEPIGHVELVHRLRACRFVLTDSGGLQEEAPAFAKPVLVLRDRTERQEGVEAGVARLVGTSRRRIVEEASRLLLDAAAYAAMSRPLQLYGDGHAGERIAELLLDVAAAPPRARLTG